MEGTRQNILAEIRRWMDDVDAPNIFWLKGYPGVGKSAIAASVMEQLRSLGRLGSSFFFQREKANSMTPNALWRVVAYDLARQYPAIKEKIVAALKKDETIMTTPNVDKLFRQLIQDSLVASEETLIGSPLVVIMDALDECGGLDGQRSEHRKNLLRTLKDWSQLPRKFKLFVTSRDESDIGRLFSTTSHQVAEVLTGESVEAQSSEDIEKFLRFRFQEISAAYSRSLRPDWPGSPTIQELTAKSQGLFIWVKVITNFAGSGDPEEQLSRILCGGGTGDMATLYSFILTSFFPDPSETLIESFRSVLGTVILAKIPLSVTSIINLFSLKPTTMERICNGLQAVMDSRETPRIQHQSFVDFLIDPSKCPSAFLIDRKRETQLLTIACLRTMKNVLRFNICDLETSYFRNSDIPNIAARVEEHIPPGLSYSCLFWASHLKDTPFGLGELRYLEDFMNKQFLHWLEVLSLMKRVNAASSMLWTLIDWIQAGGSNETMARDMQKFVATFGSIISQSIPHIYISALPFAPRKSAVSRQYRVDYPQTLKIEMGGQSEWPATQNVFVGHTRGVNSVAFSPDGRRIVSGSEDRTIRVWDAETGEVVTGPLKGHTDRVFSVAFSPDGRQIVSGSSDGTVRVWDAKTGEVVVGPLEGHTRWVVFVTFSPNGRRIVSCFSDGTVRVWDAGTGELVTGPLKGHTHRVRSVAFSPDGRRIVSGSDDGTVRVWDAETGEVVTGPLKGHTDWVFSIAFSPDGRHIVSGSSDGTVRVWDAETGKVVAGPLQGGSVRSVAFSPDSRRIVSGSFDKSIRVWDAKTGKVDAGPLEGHTDQVLSVAFSPDGRRIVSGSKDMTVRVWDAETGEVVAAPLEGHTGEVSSVAFSPGSRRTVSDFYGKTIRMWDVEADEVIPVPLEGHTDSVLSVAFSPDGRRIVSGSSDKTIQVWDAETGKVVAGPLEGHISGVSSVTFSPDGRRIVSGSGDTMVLVWDVEADEVVPVPLEGHTDSVWSVAFSPDGRRIVSGSSDKTIRVWDAETGEVVAGPLEHADWVRSVAFSPDGRRIVSGSNDTGVRVWDTETGEVVAGPLGGHMGDILSVAFSPDGRRIASGSHDTTIRVWDAETGEVVPVPLEGHIGEVWSVAFSPDGKRLMSGSYDQTIRMWDAETGKMVAGPLKRQTGGVLSVAFSPDGGRIVSGSGDNTVRVCSAPMRGPVKSLGTALCFNDTSMIEDGWVLGPNSELLFWVPPDLRTGLYRPGDVLVIGRCLKTKLDMTSFVHGESWARCKG
ncbi:hypothetical protein M408DRAFT_184821 [Serendipita vermifera MAFF 305830]|uniref:Nephrocystin 3-like N-terminal domain-containing protein n=1 Tax=Serendipita vermifera MAFF 305830 TaxID=933852 RepID=A0A0C3BMM3_SERVB|nr:hypothetical protein M408DRAFT_184821 [Serendipita vermifera MAFF 305830]